ncbi:DUF4199 domain-containing protein [Aliikangiella sp. IMCC44653]
MKNVILKYGFIAGGICVGIPFIAWLIIGGGTETYAQSEVIGYAAILLSVLVIFLAVKELKQKNTHQVIGFKKVFLLGTGVSLIAGILFGVYNLVYVAYLDPEFMDNYFNYYIQTIQHSGLAQVEIEQQIAKLQADKALFMNPWVNFIVMFFTVFLIGLVVSLFAGLIQRESQPAS